ATLIPIFWLTRHPTILYGIPWWGSLPVWVALLLVGRELLITAFRFFAKRKGVVIPAAGAGKLKTVVQNVFIGATIAWFAWKDALATHRWAGWFGNFWDDFHGWLVAITLAGAVLLTIYSLGVYLYRDRAGFVIATGGLGPTRDDMTKVVAAELLGRPLQLDEGLLRALEARFRRLGRPMPAVNRTQAEVAQGAVVLPNPRGTAPGLWLE